VEAEEEVEEEVEAVEAEEEVEEVEAGVEEEVEEAEVEEEVEEEEVVVVVHHMSLPQNHLLPAPVLHPLQRQHPHLLLVPRQHHQSPVNLPVFGPSYRKVWDPL
jgi:hypothetical protein